MTVSAILIPIPDRDFDPTEVAVSWQMVTRAGHRVVFATPSDAHTFAQAFARKLSAPRAPQAPAF